MSLSPQTPPPAPPVAGPEPSLRKNTGAKVGWQRRLLQLTLALFTFEVGIFLVAFPWTSNWDTNYFQTVTPMLRQLWPQPAFRGALTGLGFVNIYLACIQVIYTFRKP